MPKGGDLHNHLSGSSYAEQLISYTTNDPLCLNHQTFTVFHSPNCDQQSFVSTLDKNINLYQEVIDSWSMRNFKETVESGHDHFFSTFAKFAAISSIHQGEMLAETANRAGLHNESYMEIMFTLDGNASGKLAKQLGWNPDFNLMRKALFSHDFEGIIKKIPPFLDQKEKAMKSILGCNSANPKPGCQVKVRYLYQASREQPPEMVFGQLLAGFEAASHDSRVVGLNLVQAEDGPFSMRDYSLHMKMVAYLHKLYPKVTYSLHAGELNQMLAGQEGVKFHINQAVNLAKSQRIGHGVDIREEDNAEQLLKTMAENGILVEVNLSSNALILNVKGENHPLPLYLQYGVPLTLSTDDEGVNRSNLSKEYKQAAEAFNLDYLTLKTFARNSLKFSFLPGDSLWVDKAYQLPHPACQNDALGSEKPSQPCQKFIKTSEKAAIQWDLEKRFIDFEKISA